jgi:hypothetical protein
MRFFDRLRLAFGLHKEVKIVGLVCVPRGRSELVVTSFTMDGYRHELPMGLLIGENDVLELRIVRIK